MKTWLHLPAESQLFVLCIVILLHMLAYTSNWIVKSQFAMGFCEIAAPNDDLGMFNLIGRLDLVPMWSVLLISQNFCF